METSENVPSGAAPAAGPQARIGAVGRIFGVFFSPGETFADIVRRPGFLPPLIVTLLFTLGTDILLARRVDWDAVVQRNMSRIGVMARAFERMPEEQRKKALAEQARSEQRSRYYRAFYVAPLLLLFFGAVYLGAYKVAGTGVNFKTSLSLTGYAFLPLCVKQILGVPVILIKDPSTIDPDNFLASNLTAILPSDVKFWQYVLGLSVDLFSIWTILLVALAFAQVNPKKVGFGKALGVAIAITLIFTLVGVGFAALAS
jgi:hypothetical protein